VLLFKNREKAYRNQYWGYSCKNNSEGFQGGGGGPERITREIVGESTFSQVKGWMCKGGGVLRRGRSNSGDKRREGYRSGIKWEKCGTRAVPRGVKRPGSWLALPGNGGGIFIGRSRKRTDNLRHTFKGNFAHASCGSSQEQKDSIWAFATNGASRAP